MNIPPRHKFNRTKTFETEVYGEKGVAKTPHVRTDVVRSYGQTLEAAKKKLKSGYKYKTLKEFLETNS